jgi:hypothetical protein
MTDHSGAPAAQGNSRQDMNARQALAELKAELERLDKLPAIVAANQARPLLRKLWGLLDSIVTTLERSSPHGEGTDRRL